MATTILKNSDFLEEFQFKHKVSYDLKQQDYHMHKPLEVIFVETNNALCYVNGREWKIPPKSIVLLNNMDLHEIRLSNNERYERYELYFLPEYAGCLSSKETDLLECFFLRSFENPHIIPLDDKQSTECLLLLNRLINCNEEETKQSYGYDLKVKFILGELLIFVNNLYREFHGITSKAVNSSYKLIYSIINHIHSHLDDDLSLKALASNFYINRYHLSKLFKTVTGTSLIQYITTCRIIKAKELLVQDYSVDTVCSLVGYKNLSHFSRIFKQNTGLSPKQYAKFKKPNK